MTDDIVWNGQGNLWAYASRHAVQLFPAFESMPQRPVHFLPTEDFLTFISYHLRVAISQDSNDYLCDLGLRWLYQETFYETDSRIFTIYFAIHSYLTVYWGWKPQSFSLPHWGGNHTRGLYLRACHGELKIWRFVLSLRDNLTEEELEALPMSPMEENTWLEEPGEDLVTRSTKSKSMVTP